MRCHGDTWEEKCYWEKRFWQLWKIAGIYVREELCELIANEGVEEE